MNNSIIWVPITLLLFISVLFVYLKNKDDNYQNYVNNIVGSPIVCGSDIGGWIVCGQIGDMAVLYDSDMDDDYVVTRHFYYDSDIGGWVEFIPLSSAYFESPGETVCRSTVDSGCE